MLLEFSVKNTIDFAEISNNATFNFEQTCISVFQFQYKYNPVYKKYCNSLHIDDTKVKAITQIPFLPISFFKTHIIKTTEFKAQFIFESSGTTTTINSKHFVKDSTIYVESFIKAFEQFYGSPKNWCIIGLLPSYLERENSSLVFMVNELIKQSENANSGFYLNNTEQLYETLLLNEKNNQPTWLIGVTYALLDFANSYPTKLNYTTIIETGGMKGRREELTRQEVHSVLKDKFSLNEIHSEYGMTELLSQAYSKKNGLFETPSWMKVLIREEDDPFAIVSKTSTSKTGLINVIDLANIYSCSFIATDDVGRLHANGNFEVLGRRDNSDIRGCSLLAL